MFVRDSAIRYMQRHRQGDSDLEVFVVKILKIEAKILDGNSEKYEYDALRK